MRKKGIISYGYFKFVWKNLTLLWKQKMFYGDVKWEVDKHFNKKNIKQRKHKKKKKTIASQKTHLKILQDSILNVKEKSIDIIRVGVCIIIFYTFLLQNIHEILEVFQPKTNFYEIQ